MEIAGALPGASPVTGELSERDRAILAFERQWWKFAGAKEQAIRELFDMSSTDGMKIGDEIEIFRPRAEPKTDIGPAIPEVVIATGQVVRVTPYGATARVTSQQQPAIRVGESVRVTARMP